MAYRAKIRDRLAWGCETAITGEWAREGRVHRFLPTWKYKHGLLVVGLVLFSRWYWLGVSFK